MKRLFLFICASLVSIVALGQVEAEAANTETLDAVLNSLALALNTGGVYMLVFGIIKWKKKLREASPHLIPIIATLSGPLLNGLASFLLRQFGFEFDFSPVVAALAGPLSVTVDQIYRQKRKAPKKGKLPQ